MSQAGCMVESPKTNPALADRQAYVLTGEERFHDVFRDFYGGVMTHVRDDTGFWVHAREPQTAEWNSPLILTWAHFAVPRRRSRNGRAHRLDRRVRFSCLSDWLASCAR